MWLSTKTFEHVASAAFRQWRADSHCNQVHGYGLTFKFTFAGDQLDYRNWVVDFGGLKELKKSIENAFDHKLVIAQDDPLYETFYELQSRGGCKLTILKAVGCEAFAEYAYWLAISALRNAGNSNARVVSCEVFEHGANSAIYMGDQ